MLITPFFAALFGLMYIALSINVVRHRFRKRISVGTGGDVATEYAVRIHANFSEYVPFALLLFYFLEVISLSSSLVFFLASVLLVARIAHVIGMESSFKWLIFRQVGVLATIATILIASVALALHYIPVSI